MTDREIDAENGTVKVDRETDEPRWLDCTESQWETKAEIALAESEVGEAMMYADYANCRAMYEEGLTVKEIQDRFNHG